MAENKQEITPLKQFNMFLAHPRTQDYLTTVLSEKKSSFVNNITALVSNNASLQVCKPETLMFACLKATALDLPLDQNLGFAYVLPYKDNRNNVTLAQFQMGYKGFVQLAIRSGQFLSLNTTEVRKGELVSQNFVTGEYSFKMASQNRETLPVIGYVAYFKLVGGFEKYLYMTVDEMKAHAKRYSQTYKKGYGLWADESSFDSMAKKTVLKLLLSKYAPLSVDMQNAIRVDQAIMHDENSYDYPDGPEEQPQPEPEKTPEEKKEALRERKSKKQEAQLKQSGEEPATGMFSEEEDLP